jgi:hypothetical protein
MALNATTLGDEQRFRQAAFGGQNLIVLTAVPSTAAQSMVGQPLLGQVLTVNGDYECLIPLAGLATALEVHTTVTLATKTASTSLDTLYYLSNFTDPTTWTEKTAGTGTGSLTTTVLQSATISTLRGEQYARFTLTVAGSAGSVTVTRSEYNGI